MPTKELHISKQFDVELEGLRSQVLQMGGLVESQIVRAVDALVNGNVGLAEAVMAEDARINSMEVMIDEDCTHVIARRQPAAGDLRMVMAIVKTITDLERIGDEAKKIARMTKLIYESDRLHAPRFFEIKRAADLALDMLRKTLDSFARLDVNTAIQIVKKDQDLDEQFSSIIRQLISYMMEDPRTISASIEILFVAKAIERIGDHSKNMAEYVIYLVKGKDVRHTTLEEIEREASS